MSTFIATRVVTFCCSNTSVNEILKNEIDEGYLEYFGKIKDKIKELIENMIQEENNKCKIYKDKTSLELRTNEIIDAEWMYSDLIFELLDHIIKDGAKRSKVAHILFRNYDDLQQIYIELAKKVKTPKFNYSQKNSAFIFEIHEIAVGNQHPRTFQVFDFFQGKFQNVR